MVSIRKIVCFSPTSIIGSIFSWICWAIWMARNRLIFENCSASPTETSTKGLAPAREWNMGQATHVKQQNSKATIFKRRYLTDDPSLETIYFSNASWEKSSKWSGLAWVFKDTRTKINHKESKIQDFVSSPLMTEAIRSTSSLGISSIQVRYDSQTLIKVITNKQFQKEIYGILADIECLSSLFFSTSFI